MFVELEGLVQDVFGRLLYTQVGGFYHKVPKIYFSLGARGLLCLWMWKAPTFENHTMNRLYSPGQIINVGY